MARSTVQEIENAGLHDLAGIPVENVIATMDDIEPKVTYRDLYYRWERLQWRVEELDFSKDLEQWRAMPEEHRARLLFTLNNFYHGEDVVASTLAPYIAAAPESDQKIFLTTQLVDEARHVVFFDRFYTEVINVDGGDMKQRLEKIRPSLPLGFEELFYKDLVAVSERITREPDSLAALADGVMLYHLILEGALALTGQRFTLDYLRKQDLLPAFRSGFTAVTRDESRHVVFGTLLLRDLIRRDPSLAEVVTQRLIRSAPIAAAVQQPLNGDLRYMDFFGVRLREQFLFALNALIKRMRSIGLPLPKMPPYRVPAPAGLSKADIMRQIDARTAADPTWSRGKELSQIEGATPDAVFQLLPMFFLPEAAKGIEGIFESVLEGEGGSTWHVIVRDQKIEVLPGPSATPPDVRFKLDVDVWMRIAQDELDGAEAYVLGLAESEGDMELSSKFDDMFA